MASKLKGLAALLLLVALMSVARAEDKSPTIKLKGIALERLDVQRMVADTRISLEIENPGPAFTFKEASYHLKLNGHDAAEGKRDEETRVPAESSITVELPLEVNLAQLPGVTWSTITAGLKLDYELATEFNVPLLPLFNHRVQASFSGTLSLGDMAMELPAKLKEKLFGKS